MAKKRQPQYIRHNKPATTTHPSLSRSTESNPPPPTSSPSTVNERLNLLRRTQAAPRYTDIPSVTEHPTITLSKTTIESDLLPIMIPPNTTRRRPPGPPPPPSWSAAETSAQTPTEDDETLITSYREMTERLDHLPGISVPRPGSLSHMTMKSLAKNWDWHTHYDQYHLATLPASMKSSLLSYISVYGSGNGVSIENLRTLFATESEVPGATASDDVTRLDLSYSATRSIPLKQLQRYLSGASFTSSTSSDQVKPPSSVEEDSWEAYVDKLPASLSTTPFPYLTHLSLSSPGRQASWSELLSVLGHVATITHLSLARWPVPTLRGPFKSQTTSRLLAITPFAQLHAIIGTQYLESKYIEIPSSEAADVLRRLSKATYCLKWLDLEDCHDWQSALAYKSAGQCGPDWTGAWRGLETVILRQAYNLSALEDQDEKKRITARLHWALNHEQELRVSASVRGERAADGLPFLRFVYSGENPIEAYTKSLFVDTRQRLLFPSMSVGQRMYELHGSGRNALRPTLPSH